MLCYNKLTPFAVSKDKWNTKDNTDKCAGHTGGMPKGTRSGDEVGLTMKKNQACGLELCLSEGIRQAGS